MFPPRVQNDGLGSDRECLLKMGSSENFAKALGVLTGHTLTMNIGMKESV